MGWLETAIPPACKSAVHCIKTKEWDNKYTVNFHTGGIPNSNSQSQSRHRMHRSHNIILVCLYDLKNEDFPFRAVHTENSLKSSLNAAIKVQCSIELYLFCYEEKTRKLVFQHKSVKTLFPEIHAK